MSLGKITDPDAVRKAMREFDEMGRGNFLEKYGFGKARKYYLLDNGKKYDSKAIVGVAHGKQYPHLGILKSGEFSGGIATVVKKLEGLGFDVVKDPQ